MLSIHTRYCCRSRVAVILSLVMTAGYAWLTGAECQDPEVPLTPAAQLDASTALDAVNLMSQQVQLVLELTEATEQKKRLKRAILTTLVGVVGTVLEIGQSIEDGKLVLPLDEAPGLLTNVGLLASGIVDIIHSFSARGKIAELRAQLVGQNQVSVAPTLDPVLLLYDGAPALGLRWTIPLP